VAITVSARNIFAEATKSATRYDELGKTILEHPVSIPDLHATIYQALQIDPAKELYDGDRPVPITDNGRALARTFA